MGSPLTELICPPICKVLFNNNLILMYEHDDELPTVVNSNNKKQTNKQTSKQCVRVLEVVHKKGLEKKKK
jgi:hypothetical protein